MEYVIGVLVGLAFGALAGYIKYLLLWRGLVKTEDDVDGTKLVSRMLISNLANVLILLIVFLVRNVMPFEFVSTILGTAIGLSVVIKISPERDIRKKIKEDAS